MRLFKIFVLSLLMPLWLLSGALHAEQFKAFES